MSAVRDRHSPARGAIPALVGVVVTAALGFAMWSSHGPWTLTLDTGGVFLGLTVPAFRAWFAGATPEWSDLLWGGYPVIGDCTSAALYPLHLLAYVATLRAPLRFFDVAFALHMGILTAGSAALVRRLGAGAAGAALAGVLAALCPFAHYSGIAFFPVFGAHAWWPWTLLAVEALAQETTPLLGGAMMLGWVALAAQVLVGVPEQATYCAVVAAAWLLVRKSPLGLASRLGRLVVLAAGAAALSAPQLLATIGILPWSRRALTPSNAEIGSLWLTNAGQLLVPGLGVMNGMPSFFGLATIALAVVAAVMRRPRATFLLAVASLAFLYALGPQTPVYGWIHALPPLDHYRNPSKLVALVEFPLVWAAALGADALWRRPSRAARAAAVALVLAMLGERAVYVATEIPLIESVRARNRLTPAVVDRLAASSLVRDPHPTTPPVVFDAHGMLGGGYARSVGALLGISSLRAGGVAFLGSAHFALLNSAGPWPPVLALLGAGYVLAPHRDCARMAARYRWRIKEDGEDLCIVENPHPPARHAFVESAVAVESEAAMVAAMIDHPGDPMPVVTTELGPLGTGVLKVDAYAAGHARLSTVTQRPALVLVRDSFVPGWSVRVDGRAVSPLPAAGIYFVVPVGPGLHAIALDYRAPGFRTGVAVCALWILATVAGVALARRRRPG